MFACEQGCKVLELFTIALTTREDPCKRFGRLRRAAEHREVGRVPSRRYRDAVFGRIMGCAVRRVCSGTVRASTQPTACYLC